MTPKRPVKELPVLQNWDCHQCGGCCTDYVVPVSTTERQRILDQGWLNDPEFQGKPLFLRSSPWWQFWRKRYRLRQKEGDRCIFLDEKGLCKIHAKFGLETKPFACRLYPYILVPVGDHWRVSLRFACPSVAANKGRSLKTQREEIDSYAHELETWDEPEKTDRVKKDLKQVIPPPPLKGGQKLSWEDLHHFTETFASIIEQPDQPFTRRLLRCLAVIKTASFAKYDKITGKRLKEFLSILATGSDAEVPRDLSRIQKPGWIGRILFRSTLAIYLRKDFGMRRGVAGQGRIALILAMARMISGKGMLPKLQAQLPDKTLESFEKPYGALNPEISADLARYYAIKLRSYQFFGPACYDLSYWQGIAFLFLTYPAIMWLARGFEELGQTEAIRKAITVIDENYGYNPLLGHFRQKFATRLLLSQGELERLIAWYGM